MDYDSVDTDLYWLIGIIENCKVDSDSNQDTTLG